jgi:deoxyadenosine/deoxycytidine kinase
MTEIENALGRERNEKWASRTIDLDLLLFSSEIIKTEQLTIPHPQMHLRSFVLDGLSRLDAQLQHPLLKESVSKLASRLNGQNFALRLDVPQLISIAGVIGVGKTTLAERLSKFFNGKLLLEPYDTNPFMPDVYAGRKEVALDSQLYFLTNRAEQLNPDRLEAGKIAITDYIFEKELIYAGLLLNEQQLTLYEKIYPYSARKIAEPVVVIYLTDSAQNCLRRIHERNRSYEQKIEPEFLEKLSSDYARLFAGWKTSPIITVSMSKFDCTDRNDIDRLTNQIKSYVVV